MSGDRAKSRKYRGFGKNYKDPMDIPRLGNMSVNIDRVSSLLKLWNLLL